VYEPAESPAAFAVTVSAAGVFPPDGLAESQFPPLVEAVKAAVPVEHVSTAYCEGALEPEVAAKNIELMLNANAGVIIGAGGVTEAGFTTSVAGTLCGVTPGEEIVIDPK
jgi:hypothetical protein